MLWNFHVTYTYADTACIDYFITYLFLQLTTVHVFFFPRNNFSMAIFKSYRIGFCSVSQNYTLWCEHALPSIFMLSMILKTLKIALICFDEKNNHLKKKRKYSNRNNNKLSTALKIDFVLSDDERQFLHSLTNSNFGCDCNKSHY